jgi:hypothetical protein
MRGNLGRMNARKTFRGAMPRPATLARRLAPLLLATAATVAISTPAVGAISAPGVSTGSISSLAPTSVVLHGSVNPHGVQANYVFQYGTTVGYGAETPLASAGVGTTTIALAQAISGLQPNTIYHYRILASSAGGASHGGDHSFRTPRIPLSLQFVTAPNPVPFGAPLVVQGTLSGTGNGGRVVELQTRSFPYTTNFTPFDNPEVTSPTGAFSFPILGLSTNTQLRVVTTSAPLISSPILIEGVAVRVSFRVHRVHRAHRRGLFYRMYGTVTPAEVGARVGFQLIRRGAPSVNQGGAIVIPASSTVSRFSTIVRIRHSGVYEALVQVFNGAQVSAYSEGIRIR